MNRAAFLAALMSFIAAVSLAAGSPESIYVENRKPANGVKIEYALTISDPVSHLYDVEVSISGIRGTTVEVAMPAWAPGQYAIRDFARNVQSFEAIAGRNQPLTWQKMDKQTWRITKLANEDPSIRYQVYSADLTDDMADLAPAATLMYVVNQKHVPVTIKYSVPSKWKVYSALGREGDRYTADDYDTLADAPAFIGPDFKVLELNSDTKVPHRVVFSNPHIELSDVQVTADLEELVDAAAKMFGKVPYRDYTFFVKVQPATGSGGIGHLNSARIVAGENDFVNQSSYRRFLSSAANGLIHAWDGKRIRPQILGPFDYSQEVYTRLLWFTEGSAAYDADRLLLQTGVLTTVEFLNNLSLMVDALQHQPGRTLMSLEDSSLNAWTRSDNSVNNSISYAAKGELVTMLMDLEIRGRTKGEKSLDDVLRALNAKCADTGAGIPEDGVLSTLEAVAGSDFHEFYDAAVHGRKELDYERYLQQAGATINISKQPSTIYFGIESEPTDANQVRIRRVAPNSPAQRAKLDAGDILVAIDSERVSFDTLTPRIHSKRIGTTVTLTVMRGERLLTLNLLPAEFQDERWSIEETANPTPEQLHNRDAWLGRLH